MNGQQEWEKLLAKAAKADQRRAKERQRAAESRARAKAARDTNRSVR